MHSLEFRLLGPLEIDHDGRPVLLRGAKERALLALLLLRANEFVSHDRLVGDLWGEQPPQSAKHALQAYVSRIRKTLKAEGCAQILETHAGGYLLRIDPEQVDLYRFERLIAEGRAALADGETERGAETLRAALVLWHGSPLDDLAFEPFAPLEIQRLEELWLSAVEARIAAELMLRQESEVIGELEALVARNGLHERLRGQLMVALYRTGRQAEALEVYQEGRRLLVEELGIEPGEELRRLQHAILMQDPSLAPAAGRDLEAPTVTETSRQRRRLGLAALLAAVATAIAVPLLTLGGSGGDGTVPSDGLVLLDARTGRVAHIVTLRVSPGSVVAGGGMLWVTQPAAGTVQRIDVKRGSVVRTVKIGHESDGIAFGNGSLWVISARPGAIVRVDPLAGRTTEVTRVGTNPTAVAYGDGSVWVANQHDRTLSRIDSQSGSVVVTIDVDAAAAALAVGSGGVWLADEAAGRVIEIEPRTNTVVRRIAVGNGPAAIGTAGGSVWVANSLDGTVSEIDATSGSLRRTIAVGEAPSAVLVGRDAIWVAIELSESVSRITPGTGAVRTIHVGGRPIGLARLGGHIVVSVAAP